MRDRTCPKCGAPRSNRHEGYVCGTTDQVTGSITEGFECWRNQLTQAQERITKLEAVAGAAWAVADDPLGKSEAQMRRDHKRLWDALMALEEGDRQ